MKLNPDFQAGATIKTTIAKSKADPITQAIDNNFRAKPEQVPVHPKIENSVLPTVAAQDKETPLAVSVNNDQTQPKEQIEKEEKTVTGKPEKPKKENLILYLENGTRQELKVFCAKQDVSMNHFAICALEYLKEEIANGNVTISKHGYKRK